MNLFAWAGVSTGLFALGLFTLILLNQLGANKVFKGIAIGMVAIGFMGELFLVFMLVVVSAKQPEQKWRFNLDLTQYSAHGPAISLFERNAKTEKQCVDWPIERLEDQRICLYVGIIHFSAKLSQDLIMNEDVYVLRVFALGPLVKYIQLTTNPLTKEEAYQKSRSLLKMWALSQDSLEKWFEVPCILQDSLNCGFYLTSNHHENKLQPTLELDINKSTRDREPIGRIWYLDIKISWHNSSKFK